MIGTIVGALMIGLINNGLILMGLEFSQQLSGVEDRTARNQQTISGTLERLAATLEG